MKMISILLLIPLVLIFALAPNAYSSDTTQEVGMTAAKSDIAPLLTNPGFEDGSKAWNLPDGLMSIDSSTAHSGKACLKVSWDNASQRQVAFQQVAVQPGKRYFIRAWIKCQGVKGSAKGATFGLEWPGGGAYPVGVTGDTDWTEIKSYSTVASSTNTTASLFVTLDWGAVGTAWIDDVSVIEVDPKPLVKIQLDSDAVVGEQDSLPLVINIDDVAFDVIGEDAAINISVCSPPWNAPLAEQTLLVRDLKSDAGNRFSISFQTGELNEGVYKITYKVMDKSTNRLLAEPESLTAFKRPPMQCLLTPHSRIVLPGSDAPAIEVNSYRTGTLSGEVVDDKGKRLEKISPRQVSVGKSESIKLLSKYAPGKYRVRLQLSATGQPVYSSDLPFMVAGKKEVESGVLIGKDNLLLDHGKTWFPMLVYVDTAWDPVKYKEMEKRDPKLTADLLDRLAGTPLGMLDYGTPIGGLDDTIALADECAKRGVRLALSLKDLHADSGLYGIRAKAFPGMSSEEIVRLLVKRLRNHKALALYYINDELSTQFFSSLKGMRQWIYEEDPLHPTLQVHYDLECIRELAPTFDIFGPELYPWPEANLRRMAEWSDTVTSRLPKTSPFWGCLWHFKNEPMGSEKLRALSYLSIARGARGLLFYAYNEYILDANFEKRWADLVQLSKEIESRLPILLQPESKVSCKSDSTWVVLRTVSGPKGDWLLVVNSGGDKVDSVITAEKSLESASEGGKKLPLANGQLKITLEPFDVRLISLALSNRK